MKYENRLAVLATAALLYLSFNAQAQDPPPAPKLKEEMRDPWTRNDTDFIKNWQLAGPSACKLEAECSDVPSGQARTGAGLQWEPSGSWSDVVTLYGDSNGGLTYAMATVTRAQAGKVRLSVGSSNGIRVWVNGKPVLAHDGQRSLTADEDQVEVEMKQGANTLLLKTYANAAFAVRVLESGTVLTP